MFSTTVRVRRPLRSPLPVALALLLLVLVGGSSSATPRPAEAKADSVVTFGLGPANAKGVDGRPYYYYLAAGGSRLTDHVVVLNYGRSALPLTLYATDGYNTFSGSSDLLSATTRPRDVGSWVRLGLPTRSIVVPARTPNKPGSVLVPFQLSVPRGAEPGDHVGGIVASLRTVGKNAQGFQVNLDQRVGAQIYLRLAGDLRPKLQIDDLRARYTGTLNPLGTGSVKVSYVVRNVGNVRLGGRQKVTVSGFFGSWEASGLVDIPLLVPGGSAHISTVVKGVWPEVWMKGTVRVRALGLATDVNPPTRPVTASTHFWAVPWTLIAILVMLILLRIYLGRRRRRSSGGDSSPREEPSTSLPPEPVVPTPMADPAPVPAALEPTPAEPTPAEPENEPSGRSTVPLIEPWAPDLSAPASTWVTPPKARDDAS